MPETRCIGRPSKFPTQTATVRSRVKPTVQLSTYARLVPVFAATGNGSRSALSSPNAGARAVSSDITSVRRATASEGRKRRGSSSARAPTDAPSRSVAERTSRIGSTTPPRASPR